MNNLTAEIYPNSLSWVFLVAATLLPGCDGSPPVGVGDNTQDTSPVFDSSEGDTDTATEVQSVSSILLSWQNYNREFDANFDAGAPVNTIPSALVPWATDQGCEMSLWFYGGALLAGTGKWNPTLDADIAANIAGRLQEAGERGFPTDMVWIDIESLPRKTLMGSREIDFTIDNALAWTPGLTFFPGHRIAFNSSIYICNTQHVASVGEEPDVSSFWDLHSEYDQTRRLATLEEGRAVANVFFAIEQELLNQGVKQVGWYGLIRPDNSAPSSWGTYPENWLGMAQRFLDMGYEQGDPTRIWGPVVYDWNIVDSGIPNHTQQRNDGHVNDARQRVEASLYMASNDPSLVIPVVWPRLNDWQPESDRRLIPDAEYITDQLQIGLDYNLSRFAVWDKPVRVITQGTTRAYAETVDPTLHDAAFSYVDSEDRPMAGTNDPENPGERELWLMDACPRHYIDVMLDHLPSTQ